MRRFIIPILVSAVGILVMPTPGEACDPDSDWTPPPENEVAYDATFAPPTPEVMVAEVQHIGDNSAGCPALADCSFSRLWLELRVDVAGWHTVRVEGLPDEDVLYMRDSPDEEGIMGMTVAGYRDLTEPLPITVTLIDPDGYPSLPVDTMLLPPRADNGGCRVGGTGPASALLVLLALVSTRMRRRDPKGPKLYAWHPVSTRTADRTRISTSDPSRPD
jgi:hypothetical protein